MKRGSMISTQREQANTLPTEFCFRRCLLESFIFCLFGIFPLCGGETVSGLKLSQGEDVVRVEIDGKPFTSYYFSPGGQRPLVRPFLSPVVLADGTELTSDQSMINGGDHPHHRSIWVGHGKVNSVDHWLFKGENSPKQRHVRFLKCDGDTIEQELVWEGLTPEKLLLKEIRTLRFMKYADGARGIDLTVALSAGEENIKFTANNEASFCAVRLVKDFAKGGRLENSSNGIGEQACRTKPSEWCAMSGTLNARPYCVAILHHPLNPQHPTTWHARQYGFLGHIGPGTFSIESGKSVRLRYRMIFAAGDAKSADLKAKYVEFSTQ